MIYLDMDGVLMDFNRGLNENGLFVWDHRPGNRIYHHLPREQWQPDEIEHDRDIAALMASDHFWPSLKPMPDAHLLWDFCKPLGHHILTARPHNEQAAERVSKAKIGSIREHFDADFPDDRINICLRSEKQVFARPGHFLVDDLPGNCADWARAGGTAILHETARQSIAQIRCFFAEHDFHAALAGPMPPPEVRVS